MKQDSLAMTTLKPQSLEPLSFSNSKGATFPLFFDRSRKLYTFAHVLLCIMVAYSYVYFAHEGKIKLQLIDSNASYYASQAEGYLNGQFHMTLQPDKKLSALPNPYNSRSRKGINYLWDISYFNGHYYLYFSSVPILLVYLPAKLILGGYPSDAWARALFCIIAFLLSLRLITLLSGGLLTLPPWLWILTLGVGNLIPFVMSHGKFYAIPIACGMAFSMGFLSLLVEFHVNRQTKREHVAILILSFVGMVASRPNLVLVAPVLFTVIWLRYRKSWVGIRQFMAASIPIAALGMIALFLFNYVRFQSPFEFGLSYQLSLFDFRFLNLPFDFWKVTKGCYLYLTAPPNFIEQFPFIRMRHIAIPIARSFPGFRPEQVGGIFLLFPILAIGVLATIPSRIPRARATLSEKQTYKLAFGLLAFGAGACLLFHLSMGALMTSRYQLDIWPYFLASSLAFISVCQEKFDNCISRACLWLGATTSVVIGTLLGFSWG